MGDGLTKASPDIEVSLLLDIAEQELILKTIVSNGLHVVKEDIQSLRVLCKLAHSRRSAT